MMIILLLLLPTLVLSTESLIDWSKCGNGAGYLATCDCLNEHANLIGKSDTLCVNGGLQTKYFTENSAVIQLQVSGNNAKDIGEEPKIMMTAEHDERKSVVVFGCKLNKKTKKVELVGDLINEFQITLFEDRSRFQKRNAICAVKMERASKLYDKISNAVMTASFFTGKDQLKSIHDTGIFRSLRAEFHHKNHLILCNPYTFKDLSFSNDYHVKPIMNRDRDVLNCKNYENNQVSYTMRYDHSKKKGIEMKELKCEQDPSGSFLYAIVRETDEIDGATGRNKTIEEQITSSNDYTFYCAADLAETCENPVDDCDSYENPNCPTYNAEKIIGSPATLECPENKWLIDGEYYELKANPVCKRKKYSKDNSAKFYAELPSGNEVTLSGARCYTKYDCMTYSKLVVPGCDSVWRCGFLDTTDNNVLKCRADNGKLRIYSAENDKTLTESSYQCNPNTGLWYNGDIVVREGSVVGCDLDLTHPDSHSIVKKSSVADKVLPDLLNAIKTLLDTLTGDSKVPGESPNQSRLKYGATEVTHESALTGEKQP